MWVCSLYLLLWGLDLQSFHGSTHIRLINVRMMMGMDMCVLITPMPPSHDQQAVGEQFQLMVARWSLIAPQVIHPFLMRRSLVERALAADLDAELAAALEVATCPTSFRLLFVF